MTEAIIIGSGPTKDFSQVLDFKGLRIACDKEYHNLISAGIKIDYLVTLEDMDISHYFEPPHQDPKPVVVVSLRTLDRTNEVLGIEDFPVKIYSHPLLQECFNVGMMAWMYTWDKLKCKKLYLTGFDHLYPVDGYNMLHHLWRDMFRECIDDLAPKDTETIIPDMKNYKVQIRKDSLDIHNQKKEYIGCDSMDDYIRYRGRRNQLFIRQMKEWDEYV